ncbi:glycosyltransferase family 2 protein [uncultured Limosilactobacillus sp.]|uniref:glycosyltransferase family 2 protein n=1 Tax=uncultured Limosilactobacillus sp. TaxID=2837629 RepID=UPI0025D181A2|nr:glycosyltransferase family 2 protein [uncultured Limosilactobacillus sp.]
MLKSSHPSISLIIPIYKVEKFLRNCLDSIVKQTFTNFEVLMVDDGSPDNSGLICLEYQKRDPRFHYYRKPNGGAASARNYALKLARGDYFAFIDSDDFLSNDYLQVLVQQVKGQHSDIAVCSYYMMNEENRFFVPMNPDGHDTSFNRLYRPEEWVREFFNRDGMIYTAPWAKLFSRRVFHNLFFPEQIEAGDDQFTIWRAYTRADVISFQNQQAYCYVMNSQSLSHVKLSAFRYGVTCLEEQIATFGAIGWDVSYMISLYQQRLENSYQMSLQKGNLGEARKAQLKLKLLKI